MLPEEATEVRDKDELAFRRYDKNQRVFLKTLVTDEVIEEFKNKPWVSTAKPWRGCLPTSDASRWSINMRSNVLNRSRLIKS
ncbi:MAG: hypothetical protein CM1200mP20_04530 [Pseudomonadota bacterium]|nr:MAG: hypothetical protein CM1200mP20_04530 [Pseudomonadota bacterium]